jgi:hypothetical protein
MPINDPISTGSDTPAPTVKASSPPPILPDVRPTDYESELLTWARTALREGEAIVTVESQAEDVDENIRIALGDVRGSGAPGTDSKPFYRNTYTMSRVGKNVNDLASSITDFRPNGQYKTYNTLYESQGQILDRLQTSWWYNMDIDLKLQLAVKQSLVARTAFVQVVWNPTLWNGIGDIDLVIRDYRDVIPIRPNSKISIQDAVGIIIRSKNTVNWGRARYPEKAAKIQANSEGGISAAWAQRSMMSSPILDYLERSVPKKKTDYAVPTYDHYEIYVKDTSINQKAERVWVGPGPEGTNPWGYWVNPGQPLYPRLRLIVLANLNTVLFDGGSPYWHGMFPVIKLTLDPWPMSYLGKSVLADSKSAHKQYNELLQGVVQACRKALKPGIIVDRQTVNRQVLEKFDSSEEGYKLRTNPSSGQGIILEPPPQLPPYVIERMNKCEEYIDYVMGILDMRALSQLKTMNADTNVEQLLENLGPSIRTKGRILEVFLRELGQMMKANFFQFYTVGRRIEILGIDGMDFEDFDFDPGTLVPAFSPSMFKQAFNEDEGQSEMGRFFNDSGEGIDNERYQPKSRAERAQAHIRSFTYFITPNSLLSLAKTQDKLLFIQLFRMGVIDAITLLEKLDVPNIGELPGAPKTILERMQAAAQQGIVGAVSAAGRKASGEQMPQMRPDGKISESGS